MGSCSSKLLIMIPLVLASLLPGLLLASLFSGDAESTFDFT